MITIYGAAGFVGSHYFKNLIREKYAVSRDDIIPHPNSIDIVNFVSTIHNYNIWNNPHLDIDTNLSFLIDTLEGWRNNCPEAVYCFISSWFVYGGKENHGAKEDDPCDPKGFYSITKRCAEQLLISYCETYNLNYRILRLGNVIGPGDFKVSKQKNALQYLANEIKAGKDITMYGDGNYHRDIIHVDDATRAIELVMEKGKKNSIYNIGNGLTWTFVDILHYLKEITGSKSQIKLGGGSDFHDKIQVKSFYMDVTKLERLGFVPEYTGKKLFESLVN